MKQSDSSPRQKINHSNGLSTDIFFRLKQTLLECKELENDRILKAIFIHPDLQPWQNSLPEAQSQADRVDLLVEYLFRRHHRNGQSVLVTFLLNLSDRYDPGDELSHRLYNLAKEIDVI